MSDSCIKWFIMSRLSEGGSAWRPTHLSAAEDVDVEVQYFLSSLRPLVYYQPVSGSQACLCCNCGDRGQHVSQDIFVTGFSLGRGVGTLDMPVSPSWILGITSTWTGA